MNRLSGAFQRFTEAITSPHCAVHLLNNITASHLPFYRLLSKIFFLQVARGILSFMYVAGRGLGMGRRGLGKRGSAALRLDYPRSFQFKTVGGRGGWVGGHVPFKRHAIRAACVQCSAFKRHDYG